MFNEKKSLTFLSRTTISFHDIIIPQNILTYLFSFFKENKWHDFLKIMNIIILL